MADTTNTVEIKTIVNSTDAEVGLRKIGEAAAKTGRDLEKVGEGEGFNKVGKGADAAAAKVEAAQRTLVSSIQRATVAMEAGGRSSAKYYELISQQRGVDANVLAPYLAQLRAVEQAQAKATQSLAEQQAAQQRAAESARTNAAAQREAAQAQAGKDSFLAGLREQIALYGRSTDEVLRYRAAQAGVAESASPLILQLQNIRAAHEQIAAATRAEAQAQREAAQAQRESAQVQSGRDNFIASLQQQANAIGRTRAELLELQAAQMGVTTQAAPFIARLRDAEKGLTRTGMSARETANALRGVPAQFTDIFTSLQGGQAPLTVFLQQGGQLKDMFGGAGNAARAMGGYIVGLVNPFTLAAAAAVGLAVAYNQGSKEADAYARALIMTGNAAGTTAGQLGDMAENISASAGTQGAAAEALAAMAGTGRVAAANLEYFGLVAVKAQSVLGIATADMAKDMDSLGKSPLKTSEQLTEKYRYLTAAIYEQIKAAQEQGRTEDAASIAQNAYAVAIDERATKVKASLGTLETAWNSLGLGVKKAWDRMLDVGREDSLEDKLANARKQIWRASQPLHNSVGGVAQARAQLPENIALEASLVKQIKLAKDKAKAEADGIKLQEAMQSWSKQGDAVLTGKLKQQKEMNAEIATAVELGKKIRLSDEDVDKRVAAIRAKYADKSGESAIKKEAAAYASLTASIKEKLGQNALELAVGERATESQKMRTKLDAELATGALKLSDARVASVKAMIAELAVSEKLLASQKAEKAVTEGLAESAAARRGSKAALDAEYASYGKVAEVRELAQIALRAEADLEKTIQGLRKAGLPVTDEMLQRLTAEKDLRVKVEQATLAQSKALGYASQLAEQNKRFAAEFIIDDKARAAAILSIDAEMWEARIRIAGDGTEAQKMLRKEYDEWYSNQSRKPDLEAAKKAAGEVEKFLDPARAKDFGTALRDAFGDAGNEIAKMTNALEDFGQRQAEISKQKGNAALSYLEGLTDEATYTKRIADLNERSMRSQLSGYGQMTGAAAGFFDEQSAGYQALMAASKVFHAAELASTLAELAPKGISAVLGQGQGDPYSAFGRMAAMAAIVAGLGVAIGGVSSKGGATAADNQKTQGAGGVLGDSVAKSDSLARSLDLIEKNTYQGLGYSAGMLDALRNIEASMTGLSNLIVRSVGVMDGSNFGIQTGQINKVGSPVDGISRVMDGVTKVLFGPGLGDKIASAINNLWGKTKQDIVDSGIQFGGSVNALQAGKGYNQFASVDTTKSSWFGLVKNTSNSVQTQGLSAELATQFGMIFTALEDSLKVAAVGLGVGADSVTQALDNLVLQTTTLSLKDLKGDELTAAISAVISKAMDEISAATFPSFDNFRKIGEGYAETVIRVATNFQAIDTVFASFGKTFGQIGLESIGARERLIDLAGGLDKFSSQGEFFLKNFFTEAEQTAALKTRIQPTLAQYGLSTEGPDATKVFKDFVVGLDVTTEAGARAYTALMNLAPAFTEVIRSASKVFEERASLQGELDSLTLTSAQLLDKQRSALDASNKSIFDQVQAATAAKAVMDERMALQGEYDALTLTSVQLLARQRDALDESNRALFDQIQAATASKALADVNKGFQSQIEEFAKSTKSATELRALEIAGMDATTVALYDRVAALKQNAAELAGIKSANDGFQGQINDILKATMSASQLREFETKGMDKSTVALYDRLAALRAEQIAAQEAAKIAAEATASEKQSAEDARRAAEDVQRATEQMRSAWQSVTDTIFDEVARIRGLMNGGSAQSFAGAQSQFSIATAQARAGDQDAAKLLPSLSKALLDLAETNAATALDLARIRLQTLASLTGTGNALTGQHGLKVPSYAVGTNYLPSTGLVMAHEGERIVPAADNRALMARLSSPAQNNSELVAEVRALRAELSGLRSEAVATAGHTEKTARLLGGVIQDNALVTREDTV